MNPTDKKILMAVTVVSAVITARYGMSKEREFKLPGLDSENSEKLVMAVGVVSLSILIGSALIGRKNIIA